jgi:hypothetical protein
VTFHSRRSGFATATASRPGNLPQGQNAFAQMLCISGNGIQRDAENFSCRSMVLPVAAIKELSLMLEFLNLFGRLVTRNPQLLG